MSEGLVERLNSYLANSYVQADMREAAARIVALEKEVAKLKNIATGALAHFSETDFKDGYARGREAGAKVAEDYADSVADPSDARFMVRNIASAIRALPDEVGER